MSYALQRNMGASIKTREGVQSRRIGRCDDQRRRDRPARIFVRCPSPSVRRRDRFAVGAIGGVTSCSIPTRRAAVTPMCRLPLRLAALTANNTEAEVNVDLSGLKRYVRVVTTVTFTAGTSPAIPVAAAVVLGGAESLPQ
jgi:hypothetical protein